MASFEIAFVPETLQFTEQILLFYKLTFLFKFCLLDEKLLLKEQPLLLEKSHKGRFPDTSRKRTETFAKILGYEFFFQLKKPQTNQQTSQPKSQTPTPNKQTNKSTPKKALPFPVMVTFLHENPKPTNFLSWKRKTFFILLCSYIVSVPTAILCSPVLWLSLCVHFFFLSLCLLNRC